MFISIYSLFTPDDVYYGEAIFSNPDNAEFVLSF